MRGDAIMRDAHLRAQTTDATRRDLSHDSLLGLMRGYPSQQRRV